MRALPLFRSRHRILRLQWSQKAAAPVVDAPEGAREWSSSSTDAVGGGADSEAAARAMPLKAALRSLYLRVHPDLFSDFPAEQVPVHKARIRRTCVCRRHACRYSDASAAARRTQSAAHPRTPPPWRRRRTSGRSNCYRSTCSRRASRPTAAPPRAPRSASASSSGRARALRPRVAAAAAARAQVLTVSVGGCSIDPGVAAPPVV